MDPLAEKYQFNSGYVYCNGNPVKYVDPDGRDIWELDTEGNVVNQVKNEEFDQFVIFDKDGNKIEGGKYEYGTITERKGHKDADGRSITFFEVAGDGNAKELFEFLGDHYTTPKGMPIEWTHAKIGREGSGRNVIGTIHEAGKTSVGHYLREKGYTLREVNHNHPNGTDPSGRTKQPDGSPATHDILGAEFYQEKFPNIKLNVYRSRISYPERGGYHPYDKNGFIPYILLFYDK